MAKYRIGKGTSHTFNKYLEVTINTVVGKTSVVGIDWKVL